MQTRHNGGEIRGRCTRKWFVRKVEVKISLGAIAWATCKKTTSLTVASLR